MAGTPPTADRKAHPCEICGTLVMLRKVKGASGVYAVIEAETKQAHYQRNCESSKLQAEYQRLS